MAVKAILTPKRDFLMVRRCICRAAEIGQARIVMKGVKVWRRITRIISQKNRRTARQRISTIGKLTGNAVEKTARKSYWTVPVWVSEGARVPMSTFL